MQKCRIHDEQPTKNQELQENHRCNKERLFRLRSISVLKFSPVYSRMPAHRRGYTEHLNGTEPSLRFSMTDKNRWNCVFPPALSSPFVIIRTETVSTSMSRGLKMFRERKKEIRRREIKTGVIAALGSSVSTEATVRTASLPAVTAVPY